MAYKWDSPADWLADKINDARIPELASIANALLTLVDNDQIQDVFQAEMDADGYFAEGQSEDPA